jgi:HEAT repeat protein
MGCAALAAAGWMWIALGTGQTAPVADDFASRSESVLQQVARYKVVGDLVTPIALAELVSATHGRSAERQQLAQRLAQILTAPVPAAAKELACRELSRIGTVEQVPPLATLLTDENLSHMARFALERIPGRASDAALRAALARTKERLRVGVICSLGVRRDAEAVAPLTRLLSTADADTAVAAAKALGQIGDPAAAQALCRALSSAQGPVRAAVAEASLVAAESQPQQQRLALYDLLRTTDVPAPVRRAALRGAILGRQSAGVPLLVEQWNGDDEHFALGLRVMRELPGSEVTQAAATLLSRLPAERQIRLMQALAERADRAATPAVTALAAKGDLAVRAEALRALAQLGDATAVPLLIAAATGPVPELVEPATSTLARLPGEPVDVALVALVGTGAAQTRSLALDILGQRRSVSALPALFRAAVDREPAVRRAALRALGTTARKADLARLADLLVKAPTPADRTATEEALASVAAGVSDKNACAAPLLALPPQADAENQAAVLRTLSQIGGPRALAAVSATVDAADPELQDAAVRALSNWTTAEVAEPLARIARDSAHRKHKILALRGYIRLIGLPEVAPAERLRRCGLAMEMAERDDERRLVLGALGSLGTRPALDRVLTYLDQPSLKNEAAAAAIANGYKLVRSQPAVVAQAMQRVLKSVENKNVQRRAQELLERCKKG